MAHDSGRLEFACFNTRESNNSLYMANDNVEGCGDGDRIRTISILQDFVKPKYARNCYTYLKKKYN